MASKVLRRRDQTPGVGLQAVLAVQSKAEKPTPIPGPPETVSPSGYAEISVADGG